MKVLRLLVFVAVVVATNSQSDYDFDLYKRCNQGAFDLSCSNLLRSDIQSITSQLQAAVECNHDGWARHVANFCSMNRNGTRCGAGLAYNADFLRLFATCGSSFVPTNNCSDQCRNDLSIIRNDLGCCINALFNYTGNPYAYLAPLFSYHLWSKCGLQSVPTDCGTEGRLLYTLTNSQTVTCNSTQVLSRITAAVCQGFNLTLFRSGLPDIPECGNVFVPFFTDLCSRDPSGAYCVTSVTNDFTNYVTPITTNCNDRRNCSPSCRSLVSSLRSTRGCCINSVYNGTYAVAFGLNYTYSMLADSNLFSSCDVESPPLTCPSSAEGQQLKACYRECARKLA